MQRLRRLALLVVAPLVVATGPVVATAWASPAGAINPSPQQIPLVAGSPPGVSCPGGTYVAVNPGPQQSPVFVLNNPGPTQCPPGADVLINPGPTQAPVGQAVALPLTAKSCAAGTALFNQELTMIGGTPPPGGVATDPQGRTPRGRVPERGYRPGCPTRGPSQRARRSWREGVHHPRLLRASSRPARLPHVDPGPINAPALTGSFEIKAWSFDITNPATGPSHQVIVFHPSPSGLTKVKLAQFSPVVTTQPVSQTCHKGRRSPLPRRRSATRSRPCNGSSRWTAGRVGTTQSARPRPRDHRSDLLLRERLGGPGRVHQLPRDGHQRPGHADGYPITTRQRH